MDFYQTAMNVSLMPWKLFGLRYKKIDIGVLQE